MAKRPGWIAAQARRMQAQGKVPLSMVAGGRKAIAKALQPAAERDAAIREGQAEGDRDLKRVARSAAVPGVVARVWAEVTEGQGLVLGADGKPVQPGGEKS